MFTRLIMPPLLLLMFAFISGVLGGFSVWVAEVPFALALVLIGLPHGAIDLRLSATLDGVSLWGAVVRFGWYVRMMCAVVLCLWLFPVATLASFVLLSAWHFGRADFVDHQTFLKEELRVSRGSRAFQSYAAFGTLSSIVRGLLILSLPFCCHVEQSSEVAEYLVGLCGRNFQSNEKLLGSSATFTVLTCLTIETLRTFSLLRSGHWRVATLVVIETSSLVAAFKTLHPMFAMGLYFCCWHSWRHMARLSPVLLPGVTDTFRALFRLHLDSLPLLVPTLVVVCGLCIPLAGEITFRSAAFVSLLVYVVVTLPHEFLCSRLFESLKNKQTGEHAGIATLASPKSAT